MKLRWARVRFAAKRRLQRAAIRLGVWLSYRSRAIRRRKVAMGERMVMACAFGGAVEFLGEAQHPITLLTRAGPDVERLELYACDDAESGGCYDRRRFRRVEGVEATPVFGARMQRLTTGEREVDRCYFVRAHGGEGVRDSDIIRAKIASRPTQRRRGALVRERVEPLTFAWPRARDGDFWVSFLLVTEADDNTLLTGIYSWANRWTFPDVRRTPFHYHEAEPEPRLEPDGRYEAIYLAIDRDGWITDLDTLLFAGGTNADVRGAQTRARVG